MKALFSPHVRTFVAKFPVAYRRFIAVFFLSGFIAGIMAPTATAYAQNRPDPGNPHIKKEDPAVRNKAMKQDYPGGMQSFAADEKAAADAKPIVNGASDEISKKNTPAGEVLRGANNNPKITPHELVGSALQHRQYRLMQTAH